MRIRNISAFWMTTISSFVVLFAFGVMISGLFLITSTQTITNACAGEFCIGDKKTEIATVLKSNEDEVYKNMWVSKPVSITRENSDTFDYLIVGIESSWGREKRVRLKFKNQVLVEIDITHYGPLSVS